MKEIQAAMSLSFHNFNSSIQKMNKLVYDPEKGPDAMPDLSIANVIKSAGTSRQGGRRRKLNLGPNLLKAKADKKRRELQMHNVYS